MQVLAGPSLFTRLGAPAESRLTKHHLLMSATDMTGVRIPVRTSSCRHMIRPLLGSKWPANARSAEEIDMPVRASSAPAKIIRPGMVVTRLAGANHLGIRHLTLIDNTRVPGNLFGIKAPAQGQTAMMMVIPPWRKPVTREMSVKCRRVRWDPGWEAASTRHMMPDTSLTESFCQEFLRSKVLRVPLVLDLGCRGGFTADAMGWLEIGADGRWRYPGREDVQARTHEHSTYPGSGLSE